MSVQIAVKLPDETLAAVDRLVEQGAYQSRSHAVRAGLESIVVAARAEQIDAAFRDGFRRTPDTDEEMAQVTRSAVDAVREEPWETWW